MSDIAILVENLSKQYRIGRREPYKTLSGSLTDALSAPFQRFVPNRQSLREDSAPPAINDTLSTDTIWALKGVSFEIKHGEVLGVIGRNGAGKSTLLKVLSRITEPTEGHVRLLGRVGSLLEVGTGFHPELTGRENIFLNGAVLGMKRAEIQRRFDEIVTFAEVEKFLDTPVKHYSSGMYMRLAFAVAAHLDTEILLVDEVLAVGDAAFQKKCLGKMGEVARKGRTVLFVSHNLAAIQALCTRACLMVTGKMETQGSANEVVERYLRTIEQSSAFSLADRQDRQGTGRFRYISIRFEDPKGKRLEDLISGKDTVVIMEYRGQSVLRNVNVSIGFYGLFGQFLLFCNNEMAGQSFDLLPTCGEIRCLLPKLPFAAGSYSINLHCLVNGVLGDWVQEACTLQVVQGDYYGTGKNPPLGHGGFLAPQKWTFVATANSNICEKY